MAESERRRVQLDFSHEAYERLLQIRKDAEAKTNAEVVRNALRVYEWLMLQKREKFRLFLVKDDVIKEVELMI